MQQIPLLAHPQSPTGRSSPRWRVTLVLGGAALLLVLTGITFRYQDIRYSLPTPRPIALREVGQGQAVSLPPRLVATFQEVRYGTTWKVRV